MSINQSNWEEEILELSTKDINFQLIKLLLSNLFRKKYLTDFQTTKEKSLLWKTWLKLNIKILWATTVSKTMKKDFIVF